MWTVVHVHVQIQANSKWMFLGYGLWKWLKSINVSLLQEKCFRYTVVFPMCARCTPGQKNTQNTIAIIARAILLFFARLDHWHGLIDANYLWNRESWTKEVIRLTIHNFLSPVSFANFSVSFFVFHVYFAEPSILFKYFLSNRSHMVKWRLDEIFSLSLSSFLWLVVVSIHASQSLH